MATKLPRLNVVLELNLYKAIMKLAKSEKLSMSLMARDLLREAITIYEDTFWTKEAEAREKTFSRVKALTHQQVWGS